MLIVIRDVSSRLFVPQSFGYRKSSLSEGSSFPQKNKQTRVQYNRHRFLFFRFGNVQYNVGIIVTVIPIDAVH